MKKKKLSLEKFKIVKLNNPKQIFGGDGGTDGGTNGDTQTDTIIIERPTGTRPTKAPTQGD